MSEQSKMNHNEPGGARGTHLEGDKAGVTNHPKEELERQKKVVEDPQRPQK